MPNLVIILLAVSLSMDAFSLSLAYGTQNIQKKDIVKISITVGIYHFIMPILGMLIGSIIYHIMPQNIVIFIVLSYIGIQMIIEKTEKEKLEIKKILLFGLAVSLDSFSVGIGLKLITKNIPISLLLFSITSLSFTYLGLQLGKKINNKIGEISKTIGGIVLILLGLIYLIKV